MYDPYSTTVENIPSVRPRVATAPVINRFDIRQDGNSRKVAGVPLKLAKAAMEMKKRDASALKGSVSVDSPEIAAALAEEGVTLKITKAMYGAGDKQADVTKQVARWAQNSRYIPLLRYRDLCRTDPAKGEVKTLVIEYTLNGKAGKVTCADNSLVILPKN
jgi:hypothetical protein